MVRAQSLDDGVCLCVLEEDRIGNKVIVTVGVQDRYAIVKDRLVLSFIVD